jgi:hypothetical protein
MMKRLFGIVTFCAPILACAAFLGLAENANAQSLLPGIPSGPIPTGTSFTVAADWADPEDVRGTTSGAFFGAGFSRFGVMGGVGSFAEQTSYGGGGAMRLFGGPLEISAQLSGWSVDLRSTQVSAVNPAVAARASVFAIPLKLWGVIYYQLADNADDELRTTLGADFNLFPGTGVHAGYDFGDSGYTWGLGAHFQFGLPGA